MNEFKQTHDSLSIKVKTQKLTPQQVRLLKSAQSLLTHVLTTNNESDYFEASAELLKIFSSIIQHAHFSAAHKDSGIAYDEQVLEYAFDSLREVLSEKSLKTFDN